MPFEFRPAYSLLTDTALRVQMLPCYYLRYIPTSFTSLTS